jgi:proteasome lid subunit RPN8/RPN11
MLPFLKKGSIRIPTNVYKEIMDHARDSYPEECCGYLLGNDLKTRKVFYVERGTNKNTERARDRYIIDPKEMNMVDKQARVQALDIIGFYHSHPDHPDRPSEFDREMGQPGYSYLIVSVKDGKETSARSWIFEEEGEPFKEEAVKVVDI